MPAKPLNKSAGLARYSYYAYGMAIHSEIRLPELEPDDSSTSDVEVRLLPAMRQAGTGCSPSFEFAAKVQCLAWGDVGRFWVRDARKIEIEPGPNVSESVLRLPLLGPVMAVLLHGRGLLTLHASGVAIAGLGAIFLGDKTTGKSTIAAALTAAGNRLLADDILAIDFSRSGGPFVLPGFPQLKLNPDSAQVLAGDHSLELPRILPGFEKRALRISDPFPRAVVPASRIYVLRRGDRAALLPLSRQDALVALIRFSYVSRFGREAFRGSAASVHFKQCAALANAVPAFVLEVPDNLDRIEEVVLLLRADFA